MPAAVSAGLTLRSPLAVVADGESGHCGDERGSNDEHDATVLPWLCALLAACDALDVSPETQFTASVLLHRYQFLSGSLRVPTDGTVREDLIPSNPLDGSGASEVYVVAACLLLACKAENEPRHLRDIVNCVLQVRVGVPSHERTDSSSARESSLRKIDRVRMTWDPFPSGGDDGGSTSDHTLMYSKAKRRVLDTEQKMLRWLGFDVQVSHPHRLVVLIVRYLMTSLKEGNSIDPCASSRETIMDRWRLGAWQRLNSAVFSIDCLRHDVVSLACAAMDSELPSLPSFMTQAHSNSKVVLPRDLPLNVDWYLAVPGLSKESVTAARLDLERIAASFS